MNQNPKDPIVSINMAMTLDGKVARPDGKWYGISSEEDKKQMDVYRSQADAIIVGKNSILNDDPIIKIRYVKNAVNPRPVVLIRNGTLLPTKKIFVESDMAPLVICCQSNYKEVKKNLENIAEIHPLDSNDIDPKKVVGLLKRMGYLNILLEGGPKLNYSFFRQGLVHRIYLTITPFIFGMRNLPSILDGDEMLENYDKKKWKLKSCKTIGDEIFLIYETLNL